VTRVGVFGWGVVAPRSPNIERFRANLESAATWLQPFDGFGPSNFLTGEPEFDFDTYHGWIAERFPPRRFTQLDSKMGQPVKYALGAFIQSLEQNPGIEQVLQELGTKTHVYVGTGLGDLGTIHDQTLELYHGRRNWNRFWTHPERNAAFKAHVDNPDAAGPDVPPDPDSVDPFERSKAEDAWLAYWAERSDGLQTYLSQLREIEGENVEGPVASGKGRTIKHKQAKLAALRKEWGAPEAPWALISASLLWNIPNIAAAQICMTGKITGTSFAPVAACSSFGFSLRFAIDAIRAGNAKAVVIGATDPAPHPLAVGAFYEARVLAHDGQVSKPLSGLRGTHIAGGANIWIVGDLDYFKGKGFAPLGMEPVAVGITEDADHIITPSKSGPTAAIHAALNEAGLKPEDIVSWDLHATATPGDALEVENLREVLPESVLVTARKGMFGHGMSVGGGWELTAQYIAAETGKVPPTPLSRGELNAEIEKAHTNFVFDAPVAWKPGPVGKLSMGVGGVNACVISKPYDD
jgi:3-oxoacyl-[acyl-carrier-protein] synthase II